MVLSLIGMSGSGKTYWSQKLERDCGFRRICCDDLIEEKLRASGDFTGEGIGDIGRWMGWPHEPQYQERAAKYLECEIAVMKEILQKLQSGVEGFGPEYSDGRFRIAEGRRPEARYSHAVIDTTGSVIYTGEDICDTLRKQTFIIYLQSSPEERDELVGCCLENPKPVLWGDAFSLQKGETPEEAVRRSYPKLLDWRAALYERYAHIRMPTNTLRHPDLDGRGFVAILRDTIHATLQH